MGHFMAEPDENTSLLDPDAAAAEREAYNTALRRHSSVNLPPYHEIFPPPDKSSSALAIWIVVPISLLGVFVANADGSLVIASSQQIASEFNDLSNASWLVTSYVLAQCASQPLYGKLSDIFGRKANLAVAYTLFAAGCFLCGVGQEYWQVLAGRAISGIGGAGMTALVTITIADMVPVREVATWSSYVNVAATCGRALGGPVGGILCDTVGWRWCFYGQAPLALIGLILILWKMPKQTRQPESLEGQTLGQKFKRVDVVGATVLAAAISSLLLALDFTAKEAPLLHKVIPAVLFVVLAVSFYLIESYWATEPILPIRLITARPAITSYALAGFQMAAQFCTFYSTPLYFQVAAGSTVADAGLRLVPAVVGNASAGLLSGYVVSKTGRYKSLAIIASAIACLGYLAIVIRWRGNTNWAETLYIYFGGFGSGAIQSTTFIHLAASLDPSELAIAGATLYLSQNLLMLIGIQISTTVLHTRLRADLDVDLNGVKDKAKIIELAVSSVKAIRLLPPSIRTIVVHAYIDGLTWTFTSAVIFASLGLAVGFTMREKKL